MRTYKDVLEDGIYGCRVVHCFEVGIFINNDNDLLWQSIQIREHILQGAKIQWHRQELCPNKFSYKPVDVILHCTFQALKVNRPIAARFECFLNQGGLANSTFAIDHYCFSNIVLL